MIKCYETLCKLKKQLSIPSPASYDNNLREIPDIGDPHIGSGNEQFVETTPQIITNSQPPNKINENNNETKKNTDIDFCVRVQKVKTSSF